MKRFACLAAIAALGIGTSAQAQSTATADVSVTLEAAPFVNLTKAADIAFGSIEIPQSGGCGIRLNTPYDGFQGVLAHSSVVSLQQCKSLGGTTNGGKIAVSCTPGASINFVTTAANGTHAGVTIANHGQTIQVGGDGGAVGAKGSDYTTTCAANGKMNVSFTTELYVSSAAAAGTDITAGTVTLTTTLG